jgi:OOP family OmpA-OmpF porin
MGKWLTIAVALALFLALFQYGARPLAPVIQADIHARSAATVSQAGYGEILVLADGRDVSLSGQAPDQESIDDAVRIVRDLRGVRIVHADISLQRPYVTRFCKDESIIQLTGDVPDRDALSAFPERARDIFRYRTVADNLTVRSDSPAQFRHFMDEALIELGQLDEGCLTLTDQSLRVQGKIRSERAQAALQDRLTALSAMGFDISYELELPVLSDQALVCQAEANKRTSRDESVLFSFDSDVIHEVGRQLLDEVAEISKLCPDVAMQVVGHTDSVGDKDYNLQLGERRAEAVVDYLVASGVAAGRLTPVSMGFSQPVADNSTAEGRAANRRIEFRAKEN